MIINPFWFAAAGAGGVTWNPADKGADVSLSGGDLTATLTGTVTNTVVRGTTSHATGVAGKYYFEGVRNSTGASYPYLGICNAALPFTATTGNAAPGVFAVAGNNFFCYGNGASVNTGQTWANGDIEMVAVDMATLKIWFGRNGTWFNSGNPGAGTGQIFTISADTYFPMVNCRATGVGITARFASASWGFAAPSGFVQW